MAATQRLENKCRVNSDWTSPSLSVNNGKKGHGDVCPDGSSNDSYSPSCGCVRKELKKNSILYFTKEFHNFTEEFYTLHTQIFPEFSRHYKKVFYRELSSPKNASKSGDVSFFFFFSFFLQLLFTFRGRQRYQILKRMIICWRKKKFKVLYVFHKKDTQRLGGKKCSRQTTELWEVTGCAKESVVGVY